MTKYFIRKIRETRVYITVHRVSDKRQLDYIDRDNKNPDLKNLAEPVQVDTLEDWRELSDTEKALMGVADKGE